MDLPKEKNLHDTLRTMIRAGLIKSAHDCSEGGLAVALAESCFATCSPAPASAGGLGASVGAGLAPPALSANVHLDDDVPAESALFGERGARAIVSLAPENLAAVLAIARQYGGAAREIGKVTRNDAFRIEHKGRAVIESPGALLYDAWANSLERTLKTK